MGNHREALAVTFRVLRVKTTGKPKPKRAGSAAKARARKASERKVYSGAMLEIDGALFMVHDGEFRRRDEQLLREILAARPPRGRLPRLWL